MLEIKDLHVQFHTSDHEAVRGIDLTVQDGEIMGLVGESGSGKTVTAMMVSGLLRPEQADFRGRILLDGEDLLHAGGQRIRAIQGKDICVVFQEPMTSMDPLMKVGRQVEEVLELHTDLDPQQRRQAALEALAAVELPDPEGVYEKYPHELSGGMRQRVMIAIALACEPKLLIADEPTTALDVTIQAQILELMQELRQKLGMSIIMITHDLGVVASMCERIAVMYAGHIVEYGTADEIFYEPKHEYTKGLINSIPKLSAQEIERLVPIEGQPVDLLNPPAGCPFAPRCANCMKICLREMPPKTELSDTHYSHCWLLQKEEFEKGEISCE